MTETFHRRHLIGGVVVRRTELIAVVLSTTDADFDRWSPEARMALLNMMDLLAWMIEEEVEMVEVLC